MLASYLLSRTLVPTMVLYLLPAEAHVYAGGEGEAHHSAGGPIWKIHHAFNRRFEQLRSAYTKLLAWTLHHRAVTVAGLLLFALGSLALAPRIGRDFFPEVDAGQFRLHVRAPSGTRIEERRLWTGGRRHPRSCRKQAGHGADNMGRPSPSAT